MSTTTASGISTHPTTDAASSTLSGTAQGTSTPSPLRAILAAFGDGAGTLDQVAVRCGLPVSVVQAGADQLVRLGYLGVESIFASCPAGGCRSCPSAAGESVGCGLPLAARPAAASNQSPNQPHLVALTLTRAPR